MHTKSKVLVGSIKKGNSSTISLTVELFPIYAFELFPICAIRTIYTIPVIRSYRLTHYVAIVPHEWFLVNRCYTMDKTTQFQLSIFGIR